MSLVTDKKVDLLQIKVFSSRTEMGEAAGKAVSDRIRFLFSQQEIVRMIFAAAPSQNELLAYLAADKSINWQRIDVFHMDEYIGLPVGASQRFSSFLADRLFAEVKPRTVNLIDDAEGIETAFFTYAELLNEAPIDIVCLGIGENGHIAFNDPPVADFNDPKFIKQVILDDACRQQQVNDGCFPNFNAVPKSALTLTIPTLMAGKYLYCVVPGKTKNKAIKEVLTGEITTACPASILRKHENCILFTDTDAYNLM